MRDSLAAVTAAASGEPTRPVDLSKALRVNQALAGKILMAVRKHDPLLATHLMPGPEALRTFLRGARTANIASDVVGAAEEAVGQFDGLLKKDVGGRAELDAIISAWLPEARQRFELSSKQGAFRSMCNIKGVAADLLLHTLITHPSKELAGYYDGCEVQGAVGLRRFRPGVPVQFTSGISGSIGKSDRGPVWECLDGAPLMQGQEAGLLRQFCAPHDTKVEIRSGGARVQYLLVENRLGVSSTVDMFLGCVIRNAVPPQPSEGPSRRRGVGGEIQMPCRTYVLDALTHKDVWAGCSPALAIYDTATRGICDVNDPDNDIYRLHLEETIQYLGEGIERFRNPDVPRYLELLQSAFDRLGWDPADFRGHRVRVRYPVYGSQFVMAFEGPALTPYL